MAAPGKVLWEADASRKKTSNMRAFLAWLNRHHGYQFSGWQELYDWSISDIAAFWKFLAEFTAVQFECPPEQIYSPPPAGRMLGAQWFAGAQLNYARNLLNEKLPAGIISYAEGASGVQRSALSADELRIKVAACAAGLRQLGVKKSDRVAGVISNVPEAVVAMLATASIGAIWSSCSPDFGTEGVVDRLSQIEPVVVFYTTGYFYNGKYFDCRSNAASFLGRLAGVKYAVAINHCQDDQSGAGTFPAESHAVYTHLDWTGFLNSQKPEPLKFEPVPFDHPLFILFSSGTTGVPKCIVHGTGGTLLQHKKELMLHCDLKPGDRLLYFTTCGWMMWNWMVSALATGTTLVLYEGSLNHPDLSILWQLVGKERVTVLGTSPKFISACMNADIQPGKVLGGYVPLTILSTGAPLLPEHFDWIYEKIGKKVHLASISGGTDIISCFMLGNPLLPVRAGEIQAPGLGMDIDVWDDDRRALRSEKGELVCKSPFVSMPVGFWNDPDGSKYQSAYFEYFQDQPPEVWRHGDYIEWTSGGGIVVYGRSDATLNPGGVRIGTAEIYRQVETLVEVADSLAVGRKTADDTEVILFVKLNPGFSWSEDLAARIKSLIRSSLTPRHTPKDVIPVLDIPYTRSGKKVELAVTKVIHGESVKNSGALANPESLAEYQAIARQRWQVET